MMDRTRQESITVDTLSLQQLGSLLAQFTDSVSEDLPSRNTFEKSLVLPSKGYHYPPEKNAHKLSANEPRKAAEGAGENDSKEETPMPQCQVEIPSQGRDARLCVLLNKKALDRALLLLLLTAMSIGMILPFCLTVGTTIYEKSSSAGFDFTYDGACDLDSELSTHTYGDSCHVYESGICDSYLKTEGLTNLTTLHSTMISEDDVIAFFSALDVQSSPSCQEASKPFICQYVFPQCHNNGDYELVTEEQCLHVQDEACPAEWLIAKSFFPNLIPDCRQLNGTNGVVDNSSISCPNNFKLFCETCLPLCSSFSQYDKATTSTRRIVDITAAITALVGGALLIILSAIRRKKMWKFPAVFSVYSTSCPILVAIFVLITHIDDDKDLYCSHEVLTKTIKEPTMFCTVSGVTFHFCFMLMSSFWLLHLFHIYLSVVFPIRSRFLKTKKWSRRLHIIEVVGSLLISILCPAIFLLTNIKYNIAFYPPLLCMPGTQTSVFYGMAVPAVIVTVVGLNLIITITWTLFKRNGCLHSVIAERRCTISAPEAKSIILLAYYLIFMATAVVFIGKGVENVRPFRENLFAYFICQLHGDDPVCHVFQEEYYRHQSPHYLTSAVFSMMGLINWINLIFAVQIQDIKIIISKMSAKAYCLYGTST